MPERALDFQYVGTFLKNVGVRIKAEPAEYLVMRRDFFGVGPTHECRCFEDLREAFVYGLHLALLPPFYRHHHRRFKASSTGNARREAMIRAELAKLSGPS